MKLDKPRRPAVEVVDQTTLSQFLGEIVKDDSLLAIDAERASGFRYSQRAYLIQVASKSGTIFMIDPVALESIPGWEKLVSNAINPRTWILHAATQDLPCLAELGLSPKQIIDTELAARIAGKERVGLGSLAQELLDFELAKEHSAADWSQRPLSREMLDYGALDVDILHELWEALEQDLEAQGKLSWVQEEFEHLLSFKPKAPLEEPWRNLPGIVKIKDQKKLKVAASLWLARDEIARKEDVAPGRLIPDRSIMTAVELMPKTKRELADTKAFHGRASRSRLNDWWQAIVTADQVDIADNPQRGNGIPNHRSWEKRFPAAHIRLTNIRPLLVAQAEALKLPIENLITPDYFRRVMFQPEHDIRGQLRGLGARSWQVELVAPTIEAGLSQTQQLVDALEA